MQAIAAPRVVQPSYAPEPDPVERFFQELRRALGDRVYPTLKAWPGPVRVRQLRGWDWIRDALTALPADTQVS